MHGFRPNNDNRTLWQHRAVAYQAYQVEDYATALAAWQKISLHGMSNEDLLAAANTAQAAGNGAARDRWLQQAEQRGLGNNAPLLVAACATLHSLVSRNSH